MSFPCHARFTYPDAGYRGDQEQARVAGLEPGKTYAVTRLDVSRSDSAVELDGFPGHRFNAVMFEPAYPFAEAVDQVSRAMPGQGGKDSALGRAMRAFLREGADIPEPTLDEALQVAEELDTRAGRALKALEDGVYDGGDHKNWVIDQAVRILLGCPDEHVEAVDYKGQPYEYDRPGTNDAYAKWLEEHEGWDEGTPP